LGDIPAHFAEALRDRYLLERLGRGGMAVRRCCFTVGLILLGAWLPGTSLRAQGPHEHGETERVGRVAFPTSCRAEVGPAFERAVALLHLFAYEEAATAFRAIARRDTTCAMAQWGLAMTFLHPVWPPPEAPDLAAGLAAARRAAALGSTARERAYIAAILTYYRDYRHRDHRTRMLAYEAAMARVHRRYPADAEAAIFYALLVLANAEPSDTTYARARQADAILLPLFRREPEHPGLAHYIIHANDAPPLAPIALGAARHYADIAPDVPHLPPAGAVGRRHQCQPRSGGVRPALRGRTSDGRHLARPRSPPRLLGVCPAPRGPGSGGGANGRGGGLGPGRSAPAGGSPGAGCDTHPLHPGAWGLGGCRGAPAAGPRPGTPRRGPRPHAEVRALAEIERDFVGPLPRFSGPSTTILRLGAGAWLARAVGDTGLALQQADSATALEEVSEGTPAPPVPPAGELEGELLLELGRPAEAERLFERTLRREPNRARTVFGAAQGAEQRGDTATARARYGDYVALMARGDRTRPELAIAQRSLATR
jgi:tetratricopeptide (TPR) repeat protein